MIKIRVTKHLKPDIFDKYSLINVQIMIIKYMIRFIVLLLMNYYCYIICNFFSL